MKFTVTMNATIDAADITEARAAGKKIESLVNTPLVKMTLSGRDVKMIDARVVDVLVKQ